jgi:L-lactate dehydrogenase complex protein LldG
MSEREKILGRIREALTLTAPIPGKHHGGVTHKVTGDANGNGASQWLPFVGISFDEQVATFQANTADLKTDFHLLNSQVELTAKLREIAKAEGWRRVGAHDGKHTAQAHEALGLPVVRTDDAYDVNALESCDAGITECDALVAQTGSVLVTSRSAGGRALSVLPPHHVVVAHREQLVRDLPAAFDLLKQKYSSNYPSLISFITGPSRTGDIERILVLGAHGPKKLTILCF